MTPSSCKLGLVCTGADKRLPFLDDLLRVHGVRMEGQADDAGRFRSRNAGAYVEGKLICAA